MQPHLAGFGFRMTATIRFPAEAIPCDNAASANPLQPADKHLRNSINLRVREQNRRTLCQPKNM